VRARELLEVDRNYQEFPKWQLGQLVLYRYGKKMQAFGIFPHFGDCRNS
jgi:hypothetical protein